MSNDFEDDYTRAEHALTFIHDNADRDTWVQVGMALKDGLAEAGLDLWKIWSSTAHNYDEKTCESSWRNFKTGKITFATVFGLANRCRPVSAYPINGDSNMTNRLKLRNSIANKTGQLDAETTDKELEAYLRLKATGYTLKQNRQQRRQTKRMERKNYGFGRLS